MLNCAKFFVLARVESVILIITPLARAWIEICQMYEVTATAQKVIIKSAEAAATPEYGEVAKQ